MGLLMFTKIGLKSVQSHGVTTDVERSSLYRRGRIRSHAAAVAADTAAQAGPVANADPLEGAAEVKFEAVVTTGPGRVHYLPPSSLDLGRGVNFRP